MLRLTSPIRTSSTLSAALTTKRSVHFAGYGGRTEVTLIPGDGIGNAAAQSVKSIFKAQNVPVDFDEIHVTGLGKSQEPPKEYFEAIKSLKRTKVGLKGIIYTPVTAHGHPSFNVQLRKDLDVFAAVSLYRSLPGVNTRHKDVDFVIVRENTEGEYSGLETRPVPGVVESLKITSESVVERLARFAYDFAKANGLGSVTAVHKANIMKKGDGLFKNTIARVGEELYPEISSNSVIVDNCAMQVVSNSQQYKVLVTPNLYGNILSNIGAGLVGGPGVVPGVSIGREYAVFEPGCRHVGLSLTDKGTANPTATILSSVMMLRHIGLDRDAEAIARAVYTTLAEQKVATPDIGGTSTTVEFTNEVIRKLETVQ
ncbi:isocitrate dehydrogenase (NAD(+)) [Starmerella bacillaris]|uniref:Isocitrate dehydrogenase [NAD] subunit 1, mitochondrial n=1 Tax=Starmerella bacillaris TaxID=1247836 RepID=A0AAV5REQ3_STABA|nr:isocitrate dehydrogenase (NAD(+)) [Starmerella bacillaris]